ncbi:MAG: CDP-alcohol phosphatidyltransferase family protein [Phaeodactylibacter sp.]|nr:CDP-alcohol phosphatidyltransferase family protein [Phaeodactylibacter sp.]
MKHRHSTLQKILAWGVHGFTASGLIFGFLALLEIAAHEWRMAFFWLLICFLVDGLDGTFARLARVQEVLPKVNGKTIDYVIDFATYSIIPVYFFYEAQVVSTPWLYVCVVVMLLASALYYGMEGMVSEDLYFIGFPMLWNVVVFYEYFIFEWPEWAHILLILCLAVLHFVPIKFTYPSRTVEFRTLNLTASVLLFLGILAALFYYPDKPIWVTVIANGAALYFCGMAIYNTWLKPAAKLKA